jgi:hypothetical protein
MLVELWIARRDADLETQCVFLAHGIFLCRLQQSVHFVGTFLRFAIYALTPNMIKGPLLAPFSLGAFAPLQKGANSGPFIAVSTKWIELDAIATSGISLSTFLIALTHE